MKSRKYHQSGVSLIEVLVSTVILSFGMLAIGGMLAFAVQLPKLSTYRAIATMLAASHIENIRANRAGFANGDYQENLSYDGTSSVPSADTCNYPGCLSGSAGNTLARMDTANLKRALRQALPAGGMRLTRANVGGAATSTTEGDLWIVWQEPSGFATLDAGGSDNCPTQVTSTYTDPKPRCLYIRFYL
jgi:type IV pilus assembly protein PilV